jgi:superfamily II DNA/RNA helicase
MGAGKDSVESYVHRIGRTARGGEKGTAYTFFTGADSRNAGGLVRQILFFRVTHWPPLG